MDFLNPTFHSMLWSSTFMGGLTSGLDNWGGNGGLDIDPFNPQYNYNCGSGFRQHFTPLQNFISSINFDAGNYVPRTFPFPNLITPNPTVAYYLIDNNGINARNAIGFVHNRSFHYYNFTQPNNNTFYDNTVATQYLNSIPPIGNCNFSAELPPAPQPVLTGNFGVISIQFLLPSTTFQVDWYETYSPANSILQSYTFTSDVGGSADILPPDFVNTCNGNEYAFKIHLPGPPSQRPSNSSLNFVLDSLSQLSSKPPVQNNKTGQSDIKQLINKFNIYPNPGSGLYTLSVGQEGNYTVEVLNAYGGIVKGFSFTGKQTVLNIENLSNGLYTFTIKSDKGNYVQKIIKQ